MMNSMRFHLLPLLLTTLTSPAQWSPLGTGTLSNRSLCVVAGDIYLASYPNGVLKSEGGAAPFTAVNSGLTAVGGQYPVQSVGADANYLYAGTETGIFRSSIGSDTWSSVNGSLTANANVYANKFFAIGGNIMAVFAGSIAQGGGIYRSANGGSSWLIGHSGMGSNTTVYHLTPIDGTIWASTSTGLWTSTDNAQSWTPHPVVNYATFSLARSGSSLVIVSSFGIRYSTNNGTSWQDATGDPASPSKGELAALDGQLYALVGGQNGCLRSVNNGVTWSTYVDGMGQVDASAQEELHVTPTRLYCTALFDVYTLDGIGSGVQPILPRADARAWPSLFDDGFHVMSPVDAMLRLVDGTGRTVRMERIPAARATWIPRLGLAAGSYRCMLQDLAGRNIRGTDLVIAR